MQFALQPVKQRLRHPLRQHVAQPHTQRVAPACRRQRTPRLDAQRAGIGAQRAQIEAREFAQALLRLVCARGAGTQAGRGVFELLGQYRHDVRAQAAACERGRSVARVFDGTQAVAAHIVLDRARRLRQPRPQPVDAVTLDRCRHRRQARRAGAAQRLQQEGLGLVLLVVGEQHGVDARGQRHLAQRRVAFAPGPGLDTVAPRRPARQPAPQQRHRQAARGPAPRLALQVCEPAIGLRLQTVVHMQRDDLDRRHLGRTGACGGVPQRGRIAAAADRHRDASRHRGRSAAHAVNSSWCR